MSVTVLNEDRQELTDLENAHEISYTKRINEAPTASFALPVDAEKDSFCKIGRLVRLKDEDGKIGLFRIDSTRLNTESTQRYYDLFHVADTLNDGMLPGKSTVNDGRTQLTESVEEGDTTLPVRDPSEFEAGETIIIAGRDTSEKVTVESIFDGGDTAQVKMEVRGSIGPISESNKDEDVLKDQKLMLDNSLKNSYGAGTTIAVPIALQDAIKEVLNEQEDQHWQLGECDFEIDDLVFQFHDSTLLDALFSIGKKIGEKYVWKWDTDTYPWTLHLKNPVETEPVGYIDRGVNLQNINLKRDPSKIATRLYPYGTDGISIKPVKGREYIQDDDAIEKWGVREKVVRTNHNTPSALLTAAENILEQRKEPESTFEINAADLAQITDEDVHRYELGDWVEVSDPENGVEVKEILVSKSKNNLQENPAQISLEFASKTEFFETADEQLAGFRGDIDNEINETTSRFDEIRGNLLSDLEDIRETADYISGQVDNERQRIDDVRDFLESKRKDLQADHEELVDLQESLHEQIDDDITDLSITQDQIQTTVSNNEGDISVLQQTANELQIAVTNNDEDISVLSQRADEIELRVTNAEGDISNLSQRADSIELSVSNNENDISSLQVRADEIETSVSNNSGDISSFQQTADSLTSSVEDNEGNISTLQQTSDELLLAVEGGNPEGINTAGVLIRSSEIVTSLEDADGNISNITQEIDSIEATVSDHENRVSQLEVEVGEISTTVDNQGDTISQMKQTASEFSFTIYGEGDGTATMDGDDIISQINLSSSGVTIEGENVNITGDDIDITGNDITLNGNTTVEDDFNVDGNVWLKGGYATWPLTIPTSSVNNANFAVKADGTVIAKNIKELQGEDDDDPVIEDGQYIAGVKIVDAGTAGHDSDTMGDDPGSDWKKDTVWYNRSYDVPDGKKWITVVTPIDRLAPQEYNDRITNSGGFVSGIYYYFSDIHGGELTGSGTTNLHIYHWGKYDADQDWKRRWSSVRVVYQVLEIPA